MSLDVTVTHALTCTTTASMHCPRSLGTRATAQLRTDTTSPRISARVSVCCKFWCCSCWLVPLVFLLHLDLTADLRFNLDFDFCTTLPCDINADCTDDAAPAVTRVCTCRTGFLKNTSDDSCYIQPTGACCCFAYDLPLDVLEDDIEPLGTCRVGGDGTSGAVCGGTGDVACNVGLGLECIAATRTCLPSPGAGSINDLCGRPDDSKCSDGLVCGLESVFDLFDDVTREYSRCRPAGDGTLSSSCGSFGDELCQSGLLCQRNEDNRLACLSYFGGIAGDSCTAQACAPGFECDVSTFLCRLPGTGTLGAPCGGSADRSCRSYLVCSPLTQSSTPRLCRAAGDGSEGSVCGAIGDAICSSGLICDAHSLLCRATGAGLVGDRCGQPGDTFCQAGLVCGQDDSRIAYCRTAGDSNIGDSCGNALDKVCDNSLACSQRGWLHFASHIISLTDYSPMWQRAASRQRNIQLQRDAFWRDVLCPLRGPVCQRPGGLLL